MSEKPVRLQKLLASWGLASRRTIEEWMQAGRIRVDGQCIDEPGFSVIPETIRIEIDGEIVQAPDQRLPVVIALNKPFQVLTTMEDPFGRRTVADLLPTNPRVFPIGRLDYETTGLLLATNNGELSNRLLHPRYKVEKEYLVGIVGEPLSGAEVKRFALGLSLDDGLTAPCRLLATGPKIYRVFLREGRKRQIRRMFAVLGRQVKSLHRVRFGPILLGALKPGSWRILGESELGQLLTQTDLSADGIPVKVGEKRRKKP